MEQKSATAKSDMTKSEIATKQKSDTAKHEALKKVIQERIANNKNMNYTEISKEANVSYGMVRKHAENIVSELRHERLKIVN